MSGSALIGAVMVGYGMWSLIAPGEERRRELIKVSPTRSRCQVGQSGVVSLLVSDSTGLPAEQLQMWPPSADSTQIL